MGGKRGQKRKRGSPEMPEDDILTRYDQFMLLHKSQNQMSLQGNKQDPLIHNYMQAEQNWLHRPSFQGQITAWQKWLLHIPINASNGSPFFEPPKSIANKLSKVTPSDLKEYADYRLSERFMKSAEIYFHSIGLVNDIRFASLQDDDLANKENDYFGVNGMGTTQLFSIAIKNIVKSEGDVVLVPVPTYGLFVGPILDAKAKIVPISLDAYPDHESYTQAIVETVWEQSSVLYTNALFELCSIQQHYTHLRKTFPPSDKALKKEMKEVFTTFMPALKKVYSTKPESLSLKEADKLVGTINDVLNKYRQHLITEENNYTLPIALKYCNRVVGFFNVNPHMPYGNFLKQDQIDDMAIALSVFQDLTVIDDLSYYDLTLPLYVREKPGTFANSPLKFKTLSLYGLSKAFGCAAVRSGIALGSYEIIKPISDAIFKQNSSPPIHSTIALKALFQLKAQDRQDYLTQNQNEYAFKRDLAYAMIAGSENLPTFLNIEKMNKLLFEYVLDNAKVLEMTSGIQGLSCVTYPASGFFLIIDFSQYQGYYISDTRLNNSVDFHHALYALADVDTIPSEMCLEPKPCRLRLSFGLENKLIIEAISRIKAFVNCLQPEPRNQTCNDNAPPSKAARQAFTPRFAACNQAGPQREPQASSSSLGMDMG